MAIPAVSSQPTATAAANTGAQKQQATATAQPTSTTQPQSGTTAQGSTSSTSYTVSISSVARAALAEATETSVQTAQEANRGDRQAQRLLAKEQANRVGWRAKRVIDAMSGEGDARATLQGSGAEKDHPVIRRSSSACTLRNNRNVQASSIAARLRDATKHIDGETLKAEARQSGMRAPWNTVTLPLSATPDDMSYRVRSRTAVAHQQSPLYLRVFEARLRVDCTHSPPSP
jgi:hypothetical protein